MTKRRVPPVIEDFRECERKKLLLPSPNCIYGFSAASVVLIMETADRLGVFHKWMNGQTCCSCPATDSKCIHEPNSTIYFEDDVVRFLKGLPVID